MRKYYWIRENAELAVKIFLIFLVLRGVAFIAGFNFYVPYVDDFFRGLFRLVFGFSMDIGRSI